MDAVITRDERNFFAAYKIHLSKLQNELATLRQKSSDQECKLRHDAVVTDLERSLVGFNEEVLRLTKLTADQKLEIARLRFGLETVNKEKVHLESQLKRYKKECKAFQQAQERAQRPGQSQSFSSESKPILVPAENRSSNEALPPREDDRGFDAAISDMIKEEGLDKQGAIERCRAMYHSYVERHEEVMSGIKRLLMRERQANKRVSGLLANAVAQRSDLERLFCDCVKGVRKEVERRRLDAAKLLLKDRREIAEAIGNGTKNLTTHDRMRIIECFLMDDSLVQVLLKAIFNSDRKLNEITPIRPPAAAPREEPRLPHRSRAAHDRTIGFISMRQSPGREAEQHRRVGLRHGSIARREGGPAVRNGRLVVESRGRAKLFASMHAAKDNNN